MESLSGDLVNLRPPRDEDSEFLASLRNDLRTQAWNQRLPPCVMPKRIEERLNEVLKRPHTALLIIETKDGGNVGCLNYDEGPPRLSATVGISIQTDYWGKGHALEAMELLLQFLFEERGLLVVRAWTQSGNKRAVKMLEKLGFKKSARVRESAIIEGQVFDTLQMDILREEYFESRGIEDKTRDRLEIGIRNR
ncbi:MAG: GNAT family N-acetyltransferase [Thermoplasmata archaeon]